MAERARLSEERLKLIRRFMGEPAAEEEEPSDRPVPVQPLDSGPPSARPRPSRPVAVRVSQAHQPTSLHRLRIVLARQLTTSPVRFPRSHFGARWPLASVILGVIVGVLIARVI